MIYKVTNQSLFLNGTKVQDGKQISFGNSFFCFIKTKDNNQSIQNQQIKLKPFQITRNQDIDDLDRRLWNKSFIMELVRCLQKCSSSDSLFVLQRIPVSTPRYLAEVISKISIARIIALLKNTDFFILLFQRLNKLTANPKNSISDLRLQIIKEQCNKTLKQAYQRLFFILDNILLQKQSLKRSLQQTAVDVIRYQMRKKSFFSTYFQVSALDMQSDYSSEEENSQKDLNESTQSDRNSTDNNKLKKNNTNLMESVQFWKNSLKIIISCNKLKYGNTGISKDDINSMFLNEKYLKLLKIYLLDEQKKLSESYDKSKMVKSSFLNYENILKVISVALQFNLELTWSILFNSNGFVHSSSSLIVLLKSLLVNFMIANSLDLNKIKAQAATNQRQNAKITSKSKPRKRAKNSKAKKSTITISNYSLIKNNKLNLSQATSNESSFSHRSSSLLSSQQSSADNNDSSKSIKNLNPKTANRFNLQNPICRFSWIDFQNLLQQLLLISQRINDEAASDIQGTVFSLLGKFQLKERKISLIHNYLQFLSKSLQEKTVIQCNYQHMTILRMQVIKEVQFCLKQSKQINSNHNSNNNSRYPSKSYIIAQQQQEDQQPQLPIKFVTKNKVFLMYLIKSCKVLINILQLAKMNEECIQVIEYARKLLKTISSIEKGLIFGVRISLQQTLSKFNIQESFLTGEIIHM